MGVTERWGGGLGLGRGGENCRKIMVWKENRKVIGSEGVRGIQLMTENRISGGVSTNNTLKKPCGDGARGEGGEGPSVERPSGPDAEIEDLSAGGPRRQCRHTGAARGRI